MELPTLVIVSFAIFLISAISLAVSFSPDQLKLSEQDKEEELGQSLTKSQNFIRGFGAFCIGTTFVFGTLMVVKALVKALL